MSSFRSYLFLLMSSLLIASTAIAQQPAAKSTPRPPVFARVTLLSPQAGEWRTHIISYQPPHGAPSELFAGFTVAPKADSVLFLRSSGSSPWIDLSQVVSGVSSVRFLFETKPALGAGGASALRHRDGG